MEHATKTNQLDPRALIGLSDRDWLEIRAIAITIHRQADGGDQFKAAVLAYVAWVYGSRKSQKYLF